MLKKIVLGLAALSLVAVAVAAAALAWAQLAIRRERAPLPALAEVRAATAADGPVRIAVINTASQTMPRSAVLDSTRDPRPADPYVMSHPSFVLEWADGRILLIDVGMTREGAVEFGRTIELLGGGAPIEPHGSVAEHLGADARRVRGIVFTHLHIDHVGGIGDLCARTTHPVGVHMTEAQKERPNFTTRPGLRRLRESGCARIESLSGASLLSLRDFPGVSVIAAGGHTPGSQIVVALVSTPAGPRRYVFSGDTVNNIDGITYDVPKPFLYRFLIVPEDDARQGELRSFLRALHDQAGFTLLVSHDRRALEGSGVPAWGEGDAAPQT